MADREFTCGDCGFRIFTPSSSAVDAIACPECGEVQAVPTHVASLDHPEPPRAGASGRLVKRTAVRDVNLSEQATGTRTCPFCAEEIKSAAIKCKHCGERLDSAEAEAVAARRPTRRATRRRYGPESLQPEPASSFGVGQGVGALLFIVGIGILLNFWGMDTTVQVPTQTIMGVQVGGERVHNVGLMQERQNGLMVGGGMAVLGLILAVLGTGSAVQARPSRIVRDEELDSEPLAVDSVEVSEEAVPLDPRHIGWQEPPPNPASADWDGLTAEQKGWVVCLGALALVGLLLTLVVAGVKS